MFHLGRDDVPFGGVRLQCRGDGGVVAFRGAGGENHIQRVRANQLGHLVAGRFQETVYSPRLTVHSKNPE